MTTFMAMIMIMMMMMIMTTKVTTFMATETGMAQQVIIIGWGRILGTQIIMMAMTIYDDYDDDDNLHYKKDRDR